MKYIRYDSFDIIMFGDHIQHSTMHHRMGCPRDLLSAGFINIEQWECYGESISLMVRSTEDDTVLLRIQNHIHLEDLNPPSVGKIPCTETHEVPVHKDVTKRSAAKEMVHPTKFPKLRLT
jgi:hypothetical protein